MINRFKKYTSPLSEKEKFEVAPIVAEELLKRKGSCNAISSNVICSIVSTRGHNLCGSRLRKIINYIRTANIVSNVVATSSGYYIAESKDDVSEYLESLEGREAAIHNVAESLRAQMEAL